MKKRIPLISTLIFLLAACSSGTQYEPVDLYKFTFSDMDPDVMPISGWVAPSCYRGNNTLEQYQILKDSGLNCIYGLYESYGSTINGWDKEGNPKTYSGTEEIYKALEYAEAVGVKYFVRDSRLFSKSGEEFKKAFEERGYTKYSSFGGFHYTDEPRDHDAFVNIANAYEKFKTYVPLKYSFYVNLVPMEFFTFNNGKVSDYVNYINDYVDTVNPRFLSYDFYAPFGVFPKMKSTYFQQLKTFSENASLRGLPFWAFALSTSHYFESGDGYRVPTEADIYFQVNTILAYGAKAVQYFCYQTPPMDGNGEYYIGFGGSVVDENGNKSEIYDYIKNMNSYVAFIDHLLMNSTKIGLLAVEDRPAVFLSEKPSKTIREVESLKADKNVMVSVFDYIGKTLYYCVNHSLKEDVTFTLTFNKNLKYNVYPMSLEMSTETSSTYTNTLAPGRAVILETL